MVAIILHRWWSKDRYWWDWWWWCCCGRNECGKAWLHKTHWCHGHTRLSRCAVSCRCFIYTYHVLLISLGLFWLCYGCYHAAGVRVLVLLLQTKITSQGADLSYVLIKQHPCPTVKCRPFKISLSTWWYERRFSNSRWSNPRQIQCTTNVINRRIMEYDKKG